MARMVRVVRQDGTRAVELLGENEAGEFVGQSDGAKREQERRLGLGQCLGRPAVRRSNGKDQMLRTLVTTLAQPVGYLRRSKLAAFTMQKNRQGRGAACFCRLRGASQPLQKGGFGGKGFRLDCMVWSGAVNIKPRERIIV